MTLCGHFSTTFIILANDSLLICSMFYMLSSRQMQTWLRPLGTWQSQSGHLCMHGRQYPVSTQVQSLFERQDPPTTLFLLFSEKAEPLHLSLPLFLFSFLLLPSLPKKTSFPCKFCLMACLSPTMGSVEPPCAAYHYYIHNKYNKTKTQREVVDSLNNMSSAISIIWTLGPQWVGG